MLASLDPTTAIFSETKTNAGINKWRHIFCFVPGGLLLCCVLSISSVSDSQRHKEDKPLPFGHWVERFISFCLILSLRFISCLHDITKATKTKGAPSEQMK